jgi:hypothetical protein
MDDATKLDEGPGPQPHPAGRAFSSPYNQAIADYLIGNPSKIRKTAR